MNDVKQKDFRDDDGESVSERLFEETVTSADGYIALFERLADRAHKHGFSVVVTLSWHDPLSQYAASRVLWKGNYYQNLGAMRANLVRKENEG